ncbi:hypothetical protein MCOR27_008389 [Pyricularia oryzae]|nr:hypothetical protein MCOR19_004637 [Pyricularia oryzae]KAI6264617.1 hypothetical protein MCOR34_011886 [Pyricularia oryzae]KAI6272324.1 hypothetical protein MCOR27_008389 [Pyricularia oryzae]KAI6272360.1 hypothetical protein MCOR26_007402 [Pyricularia oryzae]KAI6314017.1 hypothetical protein MCOR29_007541 [Pyricularia oryzae]
MRVISLSTLNSPPLDSDSEPEHDINNTTLLFGPKAARLGTLFAFCFTSATWQPAFFSDRHLQHLVILKPLPPPRLVATTRHHYEGPTNFLGWGSLRSPAPSYGDRHTYTHIEWGDAEERRLNVRFWRFVGGMVVVVTAACIVAIVFGHYLRGSI